MVAKVASPIVLRDTQIALAVSSGNEADGFGVLDAGGVGPALGMLDGLAKARIDLARAHGSGAR